MSSFCPVRSIGDKPLDSRRRERSISKQIKVTDNRFPNDTPLDVRSIGLARLLRYKIAEMVVARLVHDAGTLKSCQLANRTWYMVVVLPLAILLLSGRDTPGSARGNL